MLFENIVADTTRVIDFSWYSSRHGTQHGRSFATSDEGQKRQTTKIPLVRNEDFSFLFYCSVFLIMAGETSIHQHILTNLGRKARERLTEERSKRPEIVRIEAPTEQQQSSAKFIIPPKKLKAAPERPRKRTRKSAVDDKDVDRWLPSIAHISQCSTAQRSRLVQLHGLPLGTTAAKVKRFFIGLTPEKILLLPTRRDQKRISQLDSLTSNPRKKGGVVVERHTPDFRVFVLFDSAPTAALAVDRSGEVMSVDDDTFEKGASIAVSMVPKPFASHFLKHMTVEVKGGQQQQLRQRLDEIERSLSPKISDILWQQADLELGLQVSGPKSRGNSSVFINPGLSGNKQLKKQIDWLLEEQKTLYYQLPFPSCELLDPSLDADPTIRLSTSAAKTIACEIERIKAKLLLIQRWGLYFSKDKMEEGNSGLPEKQN